uniref:N-terminal EF-hand calcium binding protein 3 n=1 Tax=Cyclopterus lumpus TaxID=8103 RepID=A0A8C2WIR1_CYCLU
MSGVTEAPVEQMVFELALESPALASQPTETPRHVTLLSFDLAFLSFEEFNAYFADGILTTEELQELFFSIDGRQNNNLDTDKLSEYFSEHLGEYLNVLSALESLNVAILKAMDKTKEEYQGSSVLGQFVTRFMLRETSNQLQSLQRSLQCAMEAVEEQSSPAPSVLRYDTSEISPIKHISYH